MLKTQDILLSVARNLSSFEEFRSEDCLCFGTSDINILFSVENPTLCLQLYTSVHICKQGIMFDLSRVQGSGIFNSGSYVVFMKLFRFCKGISTVL